MSCGTPTTCSGSCHNLGRFSTDGLYSVDVVFPYPSCQSPACDEVVDLISRCCPLWLHVQSHAAGFIGGETRLIACWHDSEPQYWSLGSATWFPRCYKGIPGETCSASWCAWHSKSKFSNHLAVCQGNLLGTLWILCQVWSHVSSTLFLWSVEGLVSFS